MSVAFVYLSSSVVPLIRRNRATLPVNFTVHVGHQRRWLAELTARVSIIYIVVVVLALQDPLSRGLLAYNTAASSIPHMRVTLMGIILRTACIIIAIFFIPYLHLVDVLGLVLEL